MTSTRASSLTNTTSSTSVKVRHAATACVRAAWTARAPCGSSATTQSFGHLVPTATQTACPYKGVTSGYWSVLTGTVRDGHQDLAWAYDYPTRQLLPIAGLIAFYNEKTDIDVDGLRLPQARTHFFK